MIYFYCSTIKTDKCSIVTVISNNVRRADRYVTKKFNEWGYKGKPQRLAV